MIKKEKSHGDEASNLQNICEQIFRKEKNGRKKLLKMKKKDGNNLFQDHDIRISHLKKGKIIPKDIF